MKYIAIKGDQKYLVVPQATVKEDGSYKTNVVVFDIKKITAQSEDSE